ncbi:membrane protease YdiL (CAAX protease family) [Marisediminicola sp. UYEF4]|uniref:CPBP family intramembrane glutamic endopeptidase n=1 Tax=Marisediminicola sp. UYEF4 TaxID=1756384 RepID=UPI0033915E81
MDYAYHRLTRSWPKYTWWKPLITALIGGAIFVLLSLVVAVAFMVGSYLAPDVFGGFDDVLSLGEIDLSDPVTFAFAVGSIALLLPSVILATLIMGPRPLGLLSSVAGRLRWGWLARCIPLALLVYGAVFGLSFLVIDPLTGAEPLAPVVTSTTWVLIVLALVLTPLQATAEEYVFRGYLMQTIGGWLKHPAWAILLPVPLFVFGHNYDVWGMLDVAIFAVTAAWLTWRTGGLEAAIVAHVINNTTLFVLGAFGLTDLNADSGSPIGLLVTVVIMVAYSALVVRAANRSGLVTTRTVLPPEPAPVPATGDAVWPQVEEPARD